MDTACVYTNDKKEETFATIIHCIADVSGIPYHEKKLEQIGGFKDKRNQVLVCFR
jgi:hypothetical protein